MTAEPLTIDFMERGSRLCGGCSLCCKLVPVPEIDKPGNTRCQHQRLTGCRVYHKAGFPTSCAVWSCRWLQGAPVARPDRTHYVIDVMPTELIVDQDDERRALWALQVWVDPQHRDAWRDPALLALIENEPIIALLRFDHADDALVLCPPPLSTDRTWHTVDSKLHVVRDLDAERTVAPA